MAMGDNESATASGEEAVNRLSETGWIIPTSAAELTLAKALLQGGDLQSANQLVLKAKNALVSVYGDSRDVRVLEEADQVVTQVSSRLLSLSSDEPDGDITFDRPILHLRQGEALRRLYGEVYC